MFSCACGCVYAVCEGCECESHGLLDHIPLTRLKETLRSMNIKVPFTRNHVYHTIVTSTKYKTILKALRGATVDKKKKASKSVRASLVSPPTEAKLKRVKKKVEDDCDE